MQTITLPPPKRSWFSLISWAVLLAVLVISWKGAEMDPLLLFKDSGNMATFAADFFPPDFSQWQDYLGEMAITLQIAVWGTALAVILSIPFGLMSAENIVPWWVYQPMRRLMDACRAINEMVFAMLFVVAVGLGPFAGVMALFIHTTGVLSKLLSEAVEAIEPGPVEGIRATGANKIEEILPVPLRVQRSLRHRGRHGGRRRHWRHPVGSHSWFPVPANLRPDGAHHRHRQPAGFPLSTFA